MNRIIQLLYLILLTSCSNISKETKETDLYSDVIHHYTKTDKSKQKRQAAKFLFEQMDDKGALFSSSMDSVLNSLGDSLQELSKMPPPKRVISQLKSKSAFLQSDLEFIEDHKAISSQDLIEHIDISYNNWEQLSKVSKATFKDYIQYILPYRIDNEFIDSGLTKTLDKQYAFVKDSLLQSHFTIDNFSAMLRTIKVRVDLSLMSNYENTFSPLQIHKLKTSPRCDDVAVFYVLLFRSIGIPAAIDYIPQWGNHPYMGHTWFSIKWKGKWYAYQPNSRKPFEEVYKDESIPKVFRKTFYQEGVDVTTSYTATTTIKHTTNQRIVGKPYLAIFNKNKDLNIIDEGKKRGKHITFKDIGTRGIYFVGGKIANGRFSAVSPPIYVDSLKNITYLIPNKTATKNITLLRKFPLTMGGRNRFKLEWAKSPSGSRIEASNDNFKTVDTLLLIGNYNSFKPVDFNIESAKSYKSVRYVCTSSNQLAEISYINSNGEILDGNISGNYWQKLKVEDLFDNNPLTWVSIGNTEWEAFFALTFSEPQIISKIRILTRNDGNHIEIGDTYELFIWDNGWSSLGEKWATENELSFDDVPIDGLYWLRNRTKGKEELPFMLDKDGKQYWVGQ